MPPRRGICALALRRCPPKDIAGALRNCDGNPTSGGRSVGWRQVWGALLFLLVLGGLLVLGRPVLEDRAATPRPAGTAAGRVRILWQASGSREVWAAPSGSFWAVADAVDAPAAEASASGDAADAARSRQVTVLDRDGREAGAVRVPSGAHLALADGTATPGATVPETAWLLFVAEGETVRVLGPEGPRGSQRLPGPVARLAAPSAGAAAVAVVELGAGTGTDDPGQGLGHAALALDARGRVVARIRRDAGAILAVHPAGAGRWLVAYYGLVDGVPRSGLAFYQSGQAEAWSWVTPNDGEVLYRSAAAPGGGYVAGASREALYLFTADGVRRWEGAPPGTPAGVVVTDEGRLVVLARHPWWPSSSVIMAWDDAGRRLWRRQVSGEPVSLTLSGPAVSPEVWIVTQRHALSLDSRTGDLVWAGPAGLGRISAAVAAPGALALRTDRGWTVVGPGDGP